MTQLELARITGLSNTYICDIEKGRTTPSIETLEKISKGLHMKSSFFLNNSYVNNIKNNLGSVRESEVIDNERLNNVDG